MAEAFPNINNFLSNIPEASQGAFTKMASSTPILSPEIGKDLSAVWSSPPTDLPARLGTLVSAPPPSSIQDVLNRYSTEGTTALQNLKPPAAPTFDLSGFERASANALGGKVVIPQVQKDYMSQVKDEFGQTMNAYNTTVSKGFETLQSLSDPNTAKSLTLNFMQNSLNQTLSMLQGGGIDVSALYNNLVSNYNQSTEYMQSMNKFFQNVLGLQHNLPADIQESIKAKNYSDWLVNEAKTAFAQAPKAAGPDLAGG